MDHIKNEYPDKVNVFFTDISKPSNQFLIKYFGIVSIPTQVLLDKNGNEIFRHAGYLGAEELEKIIINYLQGI